MTPAFEGLWDEIPYWHVSLEMHSGIELAERLQ